jgi:DNA-binding NtrC family response regulator
MLIVDDDIATRSALARIFALRGWEVRSAASVAEATAELDRRPDYIILDLSLTDGDGETVLEAIKVRGMNTRAVVVSGVSDVERLRAVEARFRPAAVMLKPVDPQALYAVCGRRSQRDSAVDG